VTVAVGRRGGRSPQKIVITRDIVAIPPVNEKMLRITLATYRWTRSRRGRRRRLLTRFVTCSAGSEEKLVLDLRNSASG